MRLRLTAFLTFLPASRSLLSYIERVHRLGRLKPLQMGGGVLQPCPSSSRLRDIQNHESLAAKLPSDAKLPKLVVFDLDNTLWTPELYTLRHLSNYANAGPPGPVAEHDVWLLDGAVSILYELATCARWRAAGTRVAVASRTNKGNWARSLLQNFQITPEGGTLIELIRFQEIYTGDKDRHFEALHEKSGVPFEDMLFFDDAAGGRFGNCELVASKLGVRSILLIRFHRT